MCDGPSIISTYKEPEPFSIEGVCMYHGDDPFSSRMLIIGTYNQLALHLVEEHFDIWLQVQDAHGMNRYENIFRTIHSMENVKN